MLSFISYKQVDAMDCGPTCLKIISRHYGKKYSLDLIRKKCMITKEGVSLLGLSEAAENLGFRTTGVRISFEQLSNEVSFPCIIHWNQNHFVVVYKIKKNKVYISDPANGLIVLNKEEFLNNWIQTKHNGEEKGICLILSPTPEFYQKDTDWKKNEFGFLFSYLKPYKKLIIQLFIGLIAGSILQLFFPFLTQAVVDHGIGNNDIHFVYLILIAQIVLYVSYMVLGFMKSWILLHMNARIGISMASDFIMKLLKLPLKFYDTKLLGDIIKRIEDHKRVETFLTSSGLSIIFSIFNMFVFSLLLAYYNVEIFLWVIAGAIFYIIWVFLFLNKRRQLDFMVFEQSALDQSKIVNIIHGIQDIKLNNSEKLKRWEWETIQAKLFRIKVKGLVLSQYQSAGSTFIHHLKDIIISFIAAKSVIEGDMTLGMMVAVQYIIGYINGPISQMPEFIHSFQNMKISLERIRDTRNQEEEKINSNDLNEVVDMKKDINIKNLSFSYDGSEYNQVLKNINCKIPLGKVTAIVGSSGSGKTTLMKLLLGFYEPTNGEINLGEISLNEINKTKWRENCGAVLQDGFLFSDTIANNIAVGEVFPDKKRLLNAINTANIKEFIESQPLKYNTIIGEEGNGISQGQKQRILIARAIYVNPEYIFLDEATSSLDAGNEKIIHDNLQMYMSGKTAVLIAHRLSTVKKADNIIVLDKGEIIESGKHDDLLKNKGFYYRLIKDQLELSK